MTLFQPVVEAFNECRMNVITPGQHITVDECMNSWKGGESAYRVEGMPHKAKIA